MPQAITPAAALVRVPGAVLSHEQAALLLGIALVAKEPPYRLTVPRNRSGLALPGWDVRRAPLPEEDLVRLDDGFVVTGVARTLADLCAVLPRDHAVASADSALRLGLVSTDVLVDRLRRGRGPGCPGRRAVAALVDRRSESVLESLLRMVFVTADFPAAELQHEIWLEGRVAARVDFCWPAHRLVVEADGFAFHSDREAYRRDRHRTNQLVSLGWRVLRFSWEDVRHRPEYVRALVGECLRLGA